MIADLSRSFTVAVNHVQAIHREQLLRLAEGARIRTFMSDFAMRRTRGVLRDDKLQRPSKTQN